MKNLKSDMKDIMTAEEFYQKHSHLPMPEMLKAYSMGYTKALIESVTDEEIENSSLKNYASETGVAWGRGHIDGVKWLREELLKRNG